MLAENMTRLSLTKTFTQNPRQHELHVFICRPWPHVPQEQCEGPRLILYHSEFTSSLSNPKLRKSPSLIDELPANLPIYVQEGDIAFISLVRKHVCPLFTILLKCLLCNSLEKSLCLEEQQKHKRPRENYLPTLTTPCLYTIWTSGNLCRGHTTLSVTLIHPSNRSWNQIWSIFLRQHWTKVAVNRIPTTGWGQSAVLTSAVPSRVLAEQICKSLHIHHLKPRYCIDICTCSEALIQVQQDCTDSSLTCKKEV